MQLSERPPVLENGWSQVGRFNAVEKMIGRLKMVNDETNEARKVMNIMKEHSGTAAPCRAVLLFIN
jgi:hypothetical protein